MNISTTTKCKFKGAGRRNPFGSFFCSQDAGRGNICSANFTEYTYSVATYLPSYYTLLSIVIFITFVLSCNATFADQKPLKYSVPEYISSRVPASEISIITKVATSYDLSQEQFEFLCIIRIVEHGRSGREFGVLHRRALNKSFKTQCEWAAGSVKRRYRSSSDLKAFAARWCPIGAANDPTGLNRNWYSNARQLLTKGGSHVVLKCVRVVSASRTNKSKSRKS